MAVSKKNVKATKKFEKKHLKGVLEKRKASAKIKQRAQILEKKKAKRSQDAEFYKGATADKTSNENATSRPKRPDAKVSEMSVDDFFSGGFQILDKEGKGKSTVTDTKKAQLGKRKRNGTAVAEAEDSDASSETPSEDEADHDDVVASESDSDEDLDAADIGMTKEAMDALAEKDPEFYRFLKENDPEALEFDEDADLEGIDELSGSDNSDDDDDDTERPKKKQKKNKKALQEEMQQKRDNELTRPMISKWKASMEESFSLRAARQTVLAFRCAAHLNEDADDAVSLSQRFAIKNPDVFHDILVVALKHVPLVLQHHVPVKESSTSRVYVQTEGKKFKALSALIRSFSASVLHLLTTLSDDGTLKLTLSALTPLLPYLLSFRKVLKQLVKTVVNFWAQPASSETTRITAFLVMRRLMVIGDKGVREAVLKSTYQGLVQGSRATNANTIAGINLMKNSAAELWGLDLPIGYTTAFTAIRQLAIHLRNSIVHNQNNAFRNVYNWQYVHSLDFWSCVLAQHCSTTAQEDSQLKLLVYPLVQVTLGAMRLIPTAAYFPLRFQLFRSLLRVSRATGTYIPLAPLLLEVLNSADMKKVAKISTEKQLDFTVAYKAPKSLLHTTVYQTAVGEQVVELLSEYFALWATSIAFPEFALPVIIMLKRWIKDARKRGGVNGRQLNNKVVSGLVLVVQKLEANAAFITSKRAHVTFAPRDRTQVDAFLKDFDWQKTPIGAFVVSQRQVAAERQRVLEETRKQEDVRRQEEKKQLQAVRADEENDEEDDEDNDEDVDEDEDEDDDIDDAEEVDSEDDREDAEDDE
ncbi:MAG: Nucleolar Complex 2 protein [Sporothrix epigloea]